MVKRGKFIVVEGLDGTGKTTFALSLAREMGATFLRTPPSELVRSRPLLDATLGNDPVSRKLFYASCVAFVSANVRRLVEDGNDAVVDRYWLSTCVYASLGHVDVDLQQVEIVLEEPDTTFFLDLSEEERRRRLWKRGRTAADLESIKDEKRLRETYSLELTGPLTGKVITLDTGVLGPEACVREALVALDRRAA